MMAVTLDSLRKTVKKNKGRSQALAWLADMERASGDYEAALKTVDAALAASPSDIPAMLVRAKILAGQQDFAGSISEYKKVLAKDPFCLSAHKRMGESYDKLGKEAERNACFRRVHDMDPLDPFWKDEYDVLTEEEQASLVAPPMDDSSFTMDVTDDSENAESGEDNIFANLAASLPNTDEEDNSSMDALRNSLNFASDEIAKGGDEVQDASFDQALNSSEVSSAISDILGGDDDLDVEESSGEKSSASSSLFSHFADENEKADEAVEPQLEEKSNENEFSLDSLDEPLEADEHATNVDDAFSSLLGEDELPEEAPATQSAAPAQEEGGLFEKSADADFSLNENASLDEGAGLNEDSGLNEGTDAPAESLDVPDEEPTDQENLAGGHSESAIPTTHMDFSDEEDYGEPNLLNLDESEEPKAEESATNVDDAFSSLLGDDELPEEKSEKPAETAEEEVSLEEPIAEQPAEETVEEAVEETAAPVEKTAAEPSLEETASESESAELTLDEPAAEESTADESTEKTLEESVEDSFGSLFEKSADADFSLNDEPSADESSESVLEKAPEFTPTESAENIAPAAGLVPTSHIDFSDEEDAPKADDDFVLDLDEEAPAEKLEEPAAEEVAENVAEAPAESLENVATEEDESAADEVDGAFDALFGDDDDAPAEKAVEETPVQEELAADESPKEEDLAKEMGGAFASMFGDDDATPAESAPAEEPVEKAPAEELLSQEATSAEFEEEAVKDDVEKSVDESFDSIFGADADDLPEEKSEVAEAPADASTSSVTENIEETAAPAEEPTSVFSAPIDSFEEPSDETLEEPAAEQLEEPVAETAEPVAEEAPSAELDSIDSEVSNAFKGLFDEDDSLPESDEPNNNGVDYLMSGDSDDEVAASLVENADAPLSRGATDLDDSLNTRTLADIYMEQGVYDKALEIYSDLAKKNPDNEDIKSRLEEVKKLCREKFGEV
ncbi:conserved domain protein [Fibrobacter succinogenes subsp. succinogenes S85]|uniref:Conserved domain protein n=2 Tax=Fibrobacter succinogenes (strain ATCC 19169 / S85) TaxID=59374 RepID=D9S972_FIBSS|nr:tetratricopeptide repeat protein [Fibrobacter succinogenes]ADL25061.1 conserved domain protein [Fibrobacter succinogenes subsp. succinogenes S85]